MEKQRLVTRFAPSPTGLLHAGNYRTAVFAYLMARHHQGTFILRIEDTDRARSKKEYEDNIRETLAWLGLEYDYSHRQSEWVGEHERVLRLLVERGNAYVSKEKNAEGVEREVIRFKNPGKKVTFVDLIRGPITTDTTDLGDFVIAKSFTEPLFHLTVVADDALMGVNLVIRGDDHIANTPRQLLLYEALGAIPPRYAHLPLVLSPDRSKLSKRKGAKPVLDYRDAGFLPEAILNHLAMTGWNPGSEQELFTKAELIERFSLEQVQKSGAVYDEVKLRWFNKRHLEQVPFEAFLKNAVQFFTPETRKKLEESGLLSSVVALIRERVETYGDITVLDQEKEFVFWTDAPQIEPERLVWKQDTDRSVPKTHLSAIQTMIGDVPSTEWSKESVKAAVFTYAEEHGKGSVLWPFRFALTGKERSPDPFEVAGILGKDETTKRISYALDALEST